MTVTPTRPAAERPEPSARTEAGGAEVWDLTGEPSTEAFGIADGRFAAVYRTDEPRAIVLRLAGGDQLRFEAPLISFSRSEGADGERFTVGARGATVEPSVLDRQLRGIVEQLGSPADLVTEFSDEVAAAPATQTERVRFSSPTATFGTLDISVSANVAPIAGAGRFVVGGAWTR